MPRFSSYSLSVCAALFMFMGAIAPASAAPAAPSSVLLYPSGGRIQVTADVAVKAGAFSIELPAGVQVDTLVLNVDGGIVTSLQTAPAPVPPDSPEIASIREKLRLARQEKAAANGELAAINAQISLWATPPANLSQVAEMEKLASLIPDRIKQLYAESARIEPRQKAAIREVTRLEGELIDAGGEPEGESPAQPAVAPGIPGRNARAVLVTAKVLQSDGKAFPDGPRRVSYAYAFQDCGWTPVYRLDAQPDKGLVRFAQEAEIRQASGQNWTGVSLTLASADLGSGLEPASLGSWTVRPASEVRPRAANLAMAPAQGDAMVLMEGVAPYRMKQQETAVATVWELGKQTIPAGNTVRLLIAGDDWKAAFVRVARPSRQKAVYLMADVSLPEPLALPAGTAQYQVEGIAVGSGEFAMAGSSEKIYFGTDPRVTAEMKLDTRKSGSKGFVDKRQTRSWAWTIELANHHNAPVTVRVEDPEPESRDQAIEIKTTASPEPVTEEHVNIWTLTVPAKGKNSIAYAVDVSAPAEMRLIDGR